MKNNNNYGEFSAPKIYERGEIDSSATVKSTAFVSPAKGNEYIVSELNSLLANEFTLFTKTLNYHWNVTGPRFYSMHDYLEEQYKTLLQIVDDVAERIREIGFTPVGTMEEMTERNSIKENPGRDMNTSAMITRLMLDHEEIQMQIKGILGDLSEQKLEDPATEDFLGSLLKKHEEIAWTLKSHLEQ